MNCTFSAPTYGSFDLWCTNLSHGLKFQSSRSETRTHHVLYPLTQESAEFTVTAEFSNYGRYNTFNIWLMGYILRASDPDQQIVSMRVDLPSRFYSKQGVPVRGVGWERKYDDVKWTSMITFLTVEDAVAFNSPLLSIFQLGSTAAADPQDQSKYFYPGGTQLTQNDRDAQTLKDIAAAQENLHPPNAHDGPNRLL